LPNALSNQWLRRPSVSWPALSVTCARQVAESEAFGTLRRRGFAWKDRSRANQSQRRRHAQVSANGHFHEFSRRAVFLMSSTFGKHKTKCYDRSLYRADIASAQRVNATSAQRRNGRNDDRAYLCNAAGIVADLTGTPECARTLRYAAHCGGQVGRHATRKQPQKVCGRQRPRNLPLPTR
jgi:hypothetical protein